MRRELSRVLRLLRFQNRAIDARRRTSVTWATAGGLEGERGARSAETMERRSLVEGCRGLRATVTARDATRTLVDPQALVGKPHRFSSGVGSLFQMQMLLPLPRFFSSSLDDWIYIYKYTYVPTIRYRRAARSSAAWPARARAGRSSAVESTVARGGREDVEADGIQLQRHASLDELDGARPGFYCTAAGAADLTGSSPPPRPQGTPRYLGVHSD